jgi:hypothetical protein
MLSVVTDAGFDNPRRTWLAAATMPRAGRNWFDTQVKKPPQSGVSIASFSVSICPATIKIEIGAQNRTLGSYNYGNNLAAQQFLAKASVYETRANGFVGCFAGTQSGSLKVKYEQADPFLPKSRNSTNRFQSVDLGRCVLCAAPEVADKAFGYDHPRRHLGHGESGATARL